MPALFAFSATDQAELDAVRKMLPTMPSRQKRFLTFEVGHGYELLRDLSSGEFTSLARRVVRAVEGGRW